MTAAVLIDPEQLIELADAARRLTVSHRNPHAFHEQKSELAEALRQLARGSAPGPIARSPILPARAARRMAEDLAPASTHQRPASCAHGAPQRAAAASVPPTPATPTSSRHREANAGQRRRRARPSDPRQLRLGFEAAP
jgi:hypothetical protein